MFLQKAKTKMKKGGANIICKKTFYFVWRVTSLNPNGNFFGELTNFGDLTIFTSHFLTNHFW
jgi:hypothetical protein